MPENETVTITYKLLPVMAMDAKKPKIEGIFSYLEEEETIEIPIGGDSEELMAGKSDTGDTEKPADIAKDITDDSEPDSAMADTTDDMMDETELAENTMEDDSVVTEMVSPDEEKLADTEMPDEGKDKDEDDGDMKMDSTADEQQTDEMAEAQEPEDDQKDTDDGKAKTDANIVDVPEPQTGVFYRVQIAAGKKNVKKPVFTKLYNFKEGYNLENIDGWFKYTTGYHQVYKSARDGRERITAKYDKFQGPFVAAYNDGVRITVQEALMITEQKWYQ
jgi:hypothetical protein